MMNFFKVRQCETIFCISSLHETLSGSELVMKIRPDGRFSYEYFSQPDAAVPAMIKLKTYDPSFANRVELADFQLEEIEDVAQQLNSARSETHEKARLTEDSDLADELMFAAEEIVSDRLDRILLEHQKELVKNEVSAQLYSRLGIRWSLLHDQVEIENIAESGDESVCGYPEAVVPMEMLNSEGRVMSVYELRLQLEQ